MSLTGLGEVASFATNIVNKFFPDKTQTEKDAIALELQQMAQASNERIAQMDVNKVEAANPSLLVSGGRPAVIWVCAASFAWTFLLNPMASFVMAAAGHPVTMPTLDISQMMPVLLGLLGLSGLRTQEKIKGVNGQHG